MAIIWPTENDVRDDNDAGAANAFKASTIGREEVWKDFWAANSHGYVYNGFTQVSISVLNLTLLKGKVAIGGYIVDFTNDAANPVFALTDSAFTAIWLQLLFDGGGKVNGYQWVLKTDTSIVTDAVVVGGARANSGVVQEYHPYTGSKNWVTGTFDTQRGGTKNQVVIGFRPRLLFLRDADVNSGNESRFLDGLSSVITDYGFDTSGGGGDFNDSDNGEFWAAV